MSRKLYASANRLFWVVGNGSSHRGQVSVDRMSQPWPTARLIHTPVHVSWLNQCEIYFSVVQRKVGGDPGGAACTGVDGEPVDSPA